MMKFIRMIGLKALAKKITMIVLEKVVYVRIRAMVAETDNKVDDEVAEAVIAEIDEAIKGF